MPSRPPPLNDNPFADPAFLAGLEAAGYLQHLDTSEARITARYQHALTKMQFAAHSEEFLTRAGIKKVHRSTVQFFSEDPTPMDPFVHVLVGSLPPSRQALVTPRGCETTGWTPIGSPDEADGTVHFTVSHPGFWPVTVVFDCNQQDIGREDKYATIRAADDDSDSDPEGYLPAGGRRGGMSSSARGYGSRGASGSGTYDSRRAGGRRSNSYYDDGAGRGGRGMRGASRSNSYADDDSSESDGDDYAGRGGGGGMGRSSSRAGSRRGTMDAAGLDRAMDAMSVGRPSSRAGSVRRSSSRASRRGY